MNFGEELLTHKRRSASGLAPAATVVFHLGYVKWTPSPDHWTLTNYEARVRAEGSGTVLASLSVGRPIPNPSTGLCYADITSILLPLSAGDYTTSIAAISGGGTTDSSVSPAFALPLA